MEGRLKPEWIIDRNGKAYVLYPGLLHLAHALSAGRLRITTAIVQVPSDANGQVAICRAEAAIYDEQGQLVRSCSGIGDASPQNVNRMMALHLLRLSETRAKARALRDLTNVSEAVDEADDVPDQAPEPVDELDVLRRRYAKLAERALLRGVHALPLALDADAEAITAAGKALQGRLAAAVDGVPAS